MNKKKLMHNELFDQNGMSNILPVMVGMEVQGIVVD